MKSSAGVERIGPGAEAAGELDVGLDGLVRRDGNDSVLKLIELLPAVEEVLEGGAGGRLEWTADAGSAADPGGRDSKPLQLGGGDLVTDVERFRDQRRLRKLLLLDAGERAVGRKAPAGGGRDQLGIDFLSRERGLDQRLALFDCLGARLRCGGKADDSGHMGSAHQAGCGITSPDNQAEHDQKKHRLKRCRNPKAAELGAVMDEQVAVAKQARRYGQHLRHLIPLHHRRRTEARRRVPSLKGAPQPLADARELPTASWRQQHCFRLVNEFNRLFRFAGRVVG